jgi:hypothetical protein
MSPWQEQYQRVLRWLRRIEQPAEGEIDADEYGDFLYSFFQNCWHLKDWIKNDSSLPQDMRDEIVREAHKIESLQFCADLANRTKHLTLDKFSRKNATLWQIDSIKIGDAKTGEPLSEAKIGFVIASPEVPDALGTATDLVRQAVKDWEQLLRNHKLLT